MASKKKFAATISKKKKEVKEDYTFELKNINPAHLDKEYNLVSEIVKKSQQDVKDISTVTTRLEDLGISTHKINTCDTILYGDTYKIKLFVTVGENRSELTAGVKLRCSCCHHPPPVGALMLGVPYKYVPSIVTTESYFPETINLTRTLKVKKNNDDDSKLLYKINYYEKVLSSSEEKSFSRETNMENGEKIIEGGYYETIDPVCSFNCMFSRGDSLIKTDIRFRNYRVLAHKMYHSLFGNEMGTVLPASSYLTLVDYGGFQTIEEYRKGFQFLVYRDQSQIFKAKGLIHLAGRVMQQTMID